MQKRLIVITSSVVLSMLLIAGLAGFIYYRSLRSTPQYSIALLIDAAKQDDKPQIDSLVDIDAVVDDFLPQITSKAVELYGRGLSPAVIEKMAVIATPILPAVKQRARAELPRVIRIRSEEFGYVPFFGMVMGAQRYLDISVNGDIASVKSKLKDHPLEMRMQRQGDNWRIVGVKDEQLATEIARKIGQEVIAIAKNGDNATAEKFGIGNLSDLLRQAEDLVK
jgi:uncharacterized membrane protein